MNWNLERVLNTSRNLGMIDYENTVFRLVVISKPCAGFERNNIIICGGMKARGNKGLEDCLRKGESEKLLVGWGRGRGREEDTFKIVNTNLTNKQIGINF